MVTVQPVTCQPFRPSCIAWPTYCAIISVKLSVVW